MADSSAIRAGKAYVELFADDNPLSRGLKLAEQKLKSWGASVSAIGAKISGLAGAGKLLETVLPGLAEFSFSPSGIITGLVALTNAFASSTGELQHMSERTGISIEELSALGYAAKRSGVDMESLEGGIRKMQKAIDQAGHGSKASREAFRELGVSLKDLKGLSADQQIARLADGFARIEDPTTKAALAMRIFGKSGTEMLPLLDRGSAGIAAITEEARRLGIVLTKDDVAASKQFKGALAELRATLQAAGMALARAVLPVLIDFRKTIAPVVNSVVGWVKENAGLAASVLKIAGALAAAGLALMAFGRIISLIGSGFGLVLTGLKLLAGAVVFLLSPVGLLIGLLAGGVAAWLAWTESGQAAMEDIKDAWGGITDALASGDLALAAKIAWAGLKSVWTEGVQFLKSLWIEFSSDFVDNWNGTIAMLKLGFANFSTNFQKGILVLKYKLGLISKEEGAAQNDALNAGYAGRKEEIGKEFLGKKEQIEKEKDERLQAVMGEGNDAREELKRLRKEAADKKAARQQKAAEAGAAVAQQPVAQEYGKAAGAFNAIAALRMEGGQDVYQQQLDELKDIKQAINDLLGEARMGGRFA